MELRVQLKAAVFLGLFVLEYSIFICLISAQSSSQQAPLTSACTRLSSHSFFLLSNISLPSAWPPPSLLSLFSRCPVIFLQSFFLSLLILSHPVCVCLRSSLALSLPVQCLNWQRRPLVEPPALLSRFCFLFSLSLSLFHIFVPFQPSHVLSR